MTVSFISGLIFALTGILVSLAVKDWQIAFIFSATVALSSIVLTVLSRNVTLLVRNRTQKTDLNIKPFDDVDRIVNMIGAFGSPNLVIAIILYFVIYR